MRVIIRGHSLVCSLHLRISWHGWSMWWSCIWWRIIWIMLFLLLCSLKHIKLTHHWLHLLHQLYHVHPWRNTVRLLLLMVVLAWLGPERVQISIGLLGLGWWLNSRNRLVLWRLGISSGSLVIVVESCVGVVEVLVWVIQGLLLSSS